MSIVLIGIQARSGSTRLPNKAFELISGRTMLDRVVESCKAAANFIEKRHPGTRVLLGVVTPTGDKIAGDFRGRVRVYEGDEFDVLSRYMVAVEASKPDYLVRITGDCPLIPPSVIEGTVNLALKYTYDYVSNVDEVCRTVIDGVDCEVMSRRAMDWLDEMAKTPLDREHVTPLIRKSPPDWCHHGVVMSSIDMAGVKLSVDTAEDLEKVRSAFASGYSKYQRACDKYGRARVHRL